MATKYSQFEVYLDRPNTNQRTYYSAFWGRISIESQSQNPEFRNNPGNFHPCSAQYIDPDNCYKMVRITWEMLASIWFIRGVCVSLYQKGVALFYQTAGRYIRAYSTSAAKRKRFENKVLLAYVLTTKKKGCTKLSNIRGCRKARRDTKVYSIKQTADTR